MADRLPVRVPALDRAAVDRVLARAAELHGTSSDPADGGALTEAQLVDVAREAGLSIDHVRRAIAEERTRIALPVEHGLAASVAGPATASAARVVPLPRATVAAALERWLDRDACLQVVRRQGERTLWEPRTDVLGSLRRGFTSSGDGRVLRGVTSLAVTLADAGDGQTLVRLDVDVQRSRQQRLTAGGVAAGGGVLVGGGVAAFAAIAAAPAFEAVMLALSAVPMLIGAGAGWSVARGHRATVERIQTTLEHVLDQLEQGTASPARPTPLLDVLNDVRRALR